MSREPFAETEDGGKEKVLSILNSDWDEFRRVMLELYLKTYRSPLSEEIRKTIQDIHFSALRILHSPGSLSVEFSRSNIAQLRQIASQPEVKLYMGEGLYEKLETIVDKIEIAPKEKTLLERKKEAKLVYWEEVVSKLEKIHILQTIQAQAVLNLTIIPLKKAIETFKDTPSENINSKMLEEFQIACKQHIVPLIGLVKTPSVRGLILNMYLDGLIPGNRIKDILKDEKSPFPLLDESGVTKELGNLSMLANRIPPDANIERLYQELSKHHRDFITTTGKSSTRDSAITFISRCRGTIQTAIDQKSVFNSPTGMYAISILGRLLQGLKSLYNKVRGRGLMFTSATMDTLTELQKKLEGYKQKLTELEEKPRPIPRGFT